ncbi:serine/threonine-protein kinase [Catellatospora vulcania]|uniref:serine/threonine-protein kinase n=1 Tax=Catellatospora vulcania TaxID=1460450 RepID=UPI001E473CC0|nr:serine/threonine-protein kinase [Catellatospora vulcania]
MHRPGALLGGRYRLDERIGAGGMGEVWRASDTVLGRVVAVKTVLPGLLDDPGFVRRFLAEARAMAGVRHRGVVTIHDYQGDAGGAYLVMEHIEGEPLSRTLARHGRLTVESTLAVVAQTAEALQAVHDRGMVHRDVKPGNLLVRLDGAIVLTDFGIARTPDRTSLTTPGGILGTPSYLAPEQVLGRPAEPRSDVYALGVVAYECLTGHRPFTGDNPFAVAIQRVGQPPPPLDADVPAPVAALVERALAVDPEQRWPSAAALAEAALDALGDAAPEAAAPARGSRPCADTGRSHESSRISARRRIPVLAAAAVALIVLASGGLAAWAVWGSDTLAQWTAPDGATTTGPQVPAGYVACGAAACPPAPECWGGLTATGGTAHKPKRIACDQPHDWETVVVGTLPAEAQFLRQDELMGRTDVAALCSAQAVAQRSRDASATGNWRREAWPIQVGQDTWLLYCLASAPEGGETAGSSFQVAG